MNLERYNIKPQVNLSPNKIGDGNGSISRREVLKLFSLCGFGIFVACSPIPVALPPVVDKGKKSGSSVSELPAPAVIEYNPKDILEEIHSKYGVFIPTQEEENYAQHKKGKFRYNAVPNYEEAVHIKNTLALIPNPAVLADLIIIYRDEPGNTIGPAFLGRQWPYLIKRDEYSQENITEFEDYLSERSAIQLILPVRGVKLTQATPKVANPLDLLPGLEGVALYTAINKKGIILKQPSEELKGHTYGSVISANIVHEYGHGIIDFVNRQLSANYKEYVAKRAKTYIMESPLFVDHPIFQGWARVNKWVLRNIVDYAGDYDPDVAASFRSKGENEDVFVWDRDSAYWGDLTNRKPRVSLRFTYSGIEEAFCDGFAASILKPHLLTDEENQFFNTIRRFLNSNPESLSQLA